MQVLASFPIYVHEFDSHKVHMMSRLWCTLTQIHGLVYCQQLGGGKKFMITLTKYDFETLILLLIRIYKKIIGFD
jgi:hypothetical protein